MRMSISGRQRLHPGVRGYAEAKLARLDHHASLDDLTLILNFEQARVPPASAELIVHLHHTRFAVHAEAAGLREAIDAVADRADEQVRRRHDRVTSHKG